jgi:hypothetical protein
VEEAQVLEVYQRYAGPVNGQSGKVDVLAELAQLVRETTAVKRYAHDLVVGLTAGEWQALDSPRTQATVRFWEGAADRAARLPVDLVKLKVTEREIDEIHEQWAREMAVRSFHTNIRILERLGHSNPRSDPVISAICAEEIRRGVAGDD